MVRDGGGGGNGFDSNSKFKFGINSGSVGRYRQFEI